MGGHLSGVPSADTEGLRLLASLTSPAGMGPASITPPKPLNDAQTWGSLGEGTGSHSRFDAVISPFWYNSRALVLQMGQSKKRREKLGALYGTPQGSNKPKPEDLISIRRSTISGKWQVIIDIHGLSRCLDVFHDYAMAEKDASMARQVFSRYTCNELKNSDTWQKAVAEYLEASEAAEIVSDDEVLAVLSNAGTTPKQVNARLREMGLLSDSVWNRQ
jgi:predicted transcriptional regulator